MNRMTNSQKRLERDHGFIVLTKVAAKHEYLLTGHGFLPLILYLVEQSGMNGQQIGVIGLLHRLFPKTRKGNLCDSASIM